MSFDNLMGYILSIYQCVCKISSQYSTDSAQEIGPFSLFQNLESAKPRPMKNDISQSLGLDLDNVNFTQKSIKIFHSVQEIRPFSLFQNLALEKASTDDRCHLAIVSLFS